MNEICKTEMIKMELLDFDASTSSMPSKSGCLQIQSANQTLAEASSLPDPVSLFKSLWFSGEVCCLFSDANTGKSILSTQIAQEIADSGRKVLLCDFELSAKQFSLRYLRSDGGYFSFSPNLYRASICIEDMMSEGSFEDALLQSIEAYVLSSGTEVVIVDNLTFVCLSSEDGDSASRLMMRLLQMKRQYDLSILVLAHTPKRDLSNPITQNSLGGSKKLMNFFDSAFAIAKSCKDENLRYLKQIKCRNCAFEYDASSVLVYEIVKRKDGFLCFEGQGTSTEAEHLKTQTEEDRTSLIAEIRRLSAEGNSIRLIASQLNISKSKVDRLLKS